MKKITLATLVIGIFAASTQAQAQSNVTVYGVVDLGIAKATGKTTEERENHASRLGFKGSEDLGGNLSAIFNLESEILADTGAQKGALFERQAWVGLKGGFGTVYMGRTKNLVDGALIRIEPFNADGVIGKVNEATLRAGVGASRVSNALTYNSPDFSGVVLSAQYVLSEVSGASAGYGLLAAYDNGPVSLHAGYEKKAQTVASAVKPTLYSLGGAYRFGAAKVTAAYSRGDTDVAGTADLSKSTGKYDGYLLGLVYKVGAGDAKAVYGRGKKTVAGLSDKDTAKEFGVGYDHHLSKRTDLYAYAGRERVTSVTSYQMGVSHKF